MGRRWLTRKGNYILKFNLPIGVQNMTLKSIKNVYVLTSVYPGSLTRCNYSVNFDSSWAWIADVKVMKLPRIDTNLRESLNSGLHFSLYMLKDGKKYKEKEQSRLIVWETAEAIGN